MPIVECACNAPSVSARSGKYAFKSVSVPFPLRNNLSAHCDYLTHLKDSLEMLRETLEEDQVDSTVTDACYLTNRSQELLEYAISTCPKSDRNQYSVSSVPKKMIHKHVSFVLPEETKAFSSSTQVNHLANNQTNIPLIASTGVNHDTSASGSKPRSKS